MSSEIDRRLWLKLCAGGLAASASGLPELFAAGTAALKKRPKAVIVVWTDGGMPQTDTLDMKPDAPAEVRGEFKPIDTAAPGVRVCEHLPKLAAQMKEWAVVRSVYSSEGSPSHPTASPLMHTAGLGGVGRGPKPCLGAALSSCLATPDLGLPPHIVLGKEPYNLGAGMFGSRFAPVVLAEGSVEGLRRLTTRGVPQADFDRRLALMRDLDAGFAKDRRGPLVEAQKATYERATELMASAQLKGLNPEAVPAAEKESFGDNRVGRNCLLATLLVETGVPFVEVKWNISHRYLDKNGEVDNTLKAWDTHQDNFPTLRRYLPVFDAALTATVARLKVRGLLDSTLVVVMGEMGRTPRIAKAGGRNHFGRAWSVLLAGAGIRGGQAVGASTPDGERVKDRPVKPEDLTATICAAAGVDPATEFNARTGQRIEPKDAAAAMTTGNPRLVVATAKPVAEVLP